MADTIRGEDHNDNNKWLEEDEECGGNGDEPRETTQSFTDSLRLQDAISGAIKLREAGNEAFRVGNYELSTNIYEDAAYKIVYLKGLQQLGAIPSDDSLRCNSNSIQTKQLVGSNTQATYPRRVRFHAFRRLSTAPIDH